ncbi:MAG: hypothetical protein QM736_08435 [Vicinamibacterales bacterium]
MEQATDTPLKTTPLNARHRALGARMVPFAGWEMPVEYSGITAEHMAVRERAGLFDVSHMGQIEIAGTNALEAVQRISCNDAAKLQNRTGAVPPGCSPSRERSSTICSSTSWPISTSCWWSTPPTSTRTSTTSSRASSQRAMRLP